MKLFAIVLSAALTVSLVGCNKNSGSKETTVEKDTQAAAAQEEKLQQEKLQQEKLAKRKTILEAIAVYRNSEKKGAGGQTPAYELAWRTIIDAGDEGVVELKKELEKVADSSEGDDAFETAASLMIWEIGGLDEVQTIAAIWNRIPLTINYNGIFFAALAAAKTKDMRALPMLQACLTSQDGRVFVFQTGMKIAWPETHEVLWGVFGPAGLPFLNEALKNSRNTVEQKSALRILTSAGYVPALDSIRSLSEYGIGVVKFEALRALGTFGHPDDFDKLVMGLSSKSQDEVVSCIYALLNFEDLRATEKIAPFASSDNLRVKSAALSAMSYLLTPEAMAIFNKCSKKEKNDQLKARCNSLLGQALEKMSVSKKKYMSGSKDKKSDFTNRVHKADEISYLITTGDQQLTPEEFNKTLDEWTKNQTIQGGTYKWVRSRHILGAATGEDVDKILNVRAALYLRLTGQALVEVGLLNVMVKHLVRREYRNPTGISPSIHPN